MLTRFFLLISALALLGWPARAQAPPVQVLVDGGLLATYSIDLFDKPRYLPASLATTSPDARGNVYNPETLGLCLDRAEQIAYDTTATGRQQLALYTVTDFNTYVGALYTVALENLNPVQPADWQRTISINFLGFSQNQAYFCQAEAAADGERPDGGAGVFRRAWQG